MALVARHASTRQTTRSAAAGPLDGRNRLHRRATRAGAPESGATRSWSSPVVPAGGGGPRGVGRRRRRGGACGRRGAPGGRARGRRPLDAGAPRAHPQQPRRHDCAPRARPSPSAARKPRVLVSASASAFYGMRRDDVMCDEADAPGRRRPRPHRASTGSRRGRPARRAAGVRVVHPRIGVVLGRGGALAKMQRRLPVVRRRPARRRASSGSAGSTPTTSCARCSCSRSRRRCPGPVNVVAPAPATMNELARALGRALGRPSSMRVPAFALRAWPLGDGPRRAAAHGPARRAAAARGRGLLLRPSRRSTSALADLADSLAEGRMAGRVVNASVRRLIAAVGVFATLVAVGTVGYFVLGHGALGASATART